MALGVPGTGPHGKIRELRQIINNCKYEISLIERRIKRGSKSGYERRIAENRAEIKSIMGKIKRGEKFPD